MSTGESLAWESTAGLGMASTAVLAMASAEESMALESTAELGMASTAAVELAVEVPEQFADRAKVVVAIAQYPAEALRDSAPTADSGQLARLAVGMALSQSTAKVGSTAMARKAGFVRRGSQTAQQSPATTRLAVRVM